VVGGVFTSVLFSALGMAILQQLGGLPMEIAEKPKVLPRRAATSLRRVLLMAAAIALLLLLVVYCVVSIVAANDLSRPERHPVVGTPADVGLAYQSIEFPSEVDHLPLRGWYISAGGQRAIVMLHGLDGNRDSGSAALPIAKALVADGYDVLMFDLRGHGESGGERYSLGQLEVRDLAGALDVVRARGVHQIGTLGFSLGALTELNAAPDHPEMRAIVADSAAANIYPVLEAQFTNRSGMPSIFVPGVVWFGRLLYGIDLADDVPARQVARLGNRPLLLIHGTADALFPVSNAYALQKAGAKDPNLQLWIVPDACHTCAYEKNPELYLRRVIGFFDQNLQ
jgi:uncharacterized protein